MSEFNIYARKLDTAFKEARSEYNTAFRALQDAQQGQRDANAWKPGDSAEEKQVRTTRAALEKLHALAPLPVRSLIASASSRS